MKRETGHAGETTMSEKTTTGRITMDYDLAMAIGHDAASRRMRKAGRVKWSRGDLNASVDAFYACFGTTCERYHADMMAGLPDPIPARTRR